MPNEGIYKIGNTAAGKQMDMDSAGGDWRDVHLQPDNATTNQEWRIRGVPGVPGKYTIEWAGGPNKLLTAYRAAVFPQPNQPPITYTQVRAGQGQAPGSVQWMFVDAGPGLYRILNDGYGFSLGHNNDDVNTIKQGNDIWELKFLRP